MTCVVTPSSSTVENLYPFNTTGSFTPGLETTGPLNNGIFKADYVPGAKNHISGVFFRTRADQTVNTAAGQLLPQWRNGVIDRVDFSTVAWTWIPNSTWVNDLRWGLAYFKNETTVLDGNINPAAPWPTGYGINTGVTNPAVFRDAVRYDYRLHQPIRHWQQRADRPRSGRQLVDHQTTFPICAASIASSLVVEFIEVLWDEGHWRQRTSAICRLGHVCKPERISSPAHPSGVRFSSATIPTISGSTITRVSLRMTGGSPADSR